MKKDNTVQRKPARLLTPGMTFQGMFEPDGTGTYQIIGGVTKADGVLLAAAPELLEALEAMVNWTEALPNHHENFEKCEHAYKLAGIALSKAKGWKNGNS